jgi:hypothetical protein
MSKSITSLDKLPQCRSAPSSALRSLRRTAGGYASVARLDETALQPSRYVTIFANRTTSKYFNMSSASKFSAPCLWRLYGLS